MQWTDDAIVLGARRHGETSVILELMTAAHGRHLGLVRGGRGRRLAPVIQAGNTVEATWQARLDEHLGFYRIEGVTLRTGALMESAAALHAFGWAAALLRFLPERDPHPELYDTLRVVIARLDEPALLAALMARFELALLGDLGFGLDLAQCAATGATTDLLWVSPRSGRAVGRAAGEPYRDRLLALPAFLTNAGDENAPPPEEVRAGLALTAFFLERDVTGPRGLALPEARATFLRVQGADAASPAR